MKRQRIALFGSTGSIGRSVLDVVRHLPDRFEVTVLAANRSVRTICAQAREFKPAQAVLSDLDACKKARRLLGAETEVLWGPAALIDAAAARSTDTVVMAMSGTAGVLATVAALELGKKVALATKEILVGYGEPVMRIARMHGGTIMPIDSELSAVHQCLTRKAPRTKDKRQKTEMDTSTVKRVILTASGGPFWRRGLPSRARLSDVLKHPTWSMGRKITVDSATLMNKGLEVIETCRLFGLRPGQVVPVIHPQSVVHSLVEFNDGSVIAQLSLPDMRLPIQYALTWPDRTPSLARTLDLAGTGSLDFHAVHANRFPCLRLAYDALQAGPAATCALNSANQIAVDAFIAGRIAFGDIPRVIERVLGGLDTVARSARPGISRLLRLETWAAEQAAGEVASYGSRRPRRKE
ncbi:1-deoxy-D-xylulose-5-phosphate reductoisomerase [candidate division WOR-3 bacterium]|nr:1-deoxy-D-xylulose-5-phosphate reductoisomerase [candidate division WOR-3 bacterium]